MVSHGYFDSIFEQEYEYVWNLSPRKVGEPDDEPADVEVPEDAITVICSEHAEKALAELRGVDFYSRWLMGL